MPQTLEALAEIRAINEAFPYNDPVREWKEQGKKVIGWWCCYVPEEVIHAAGMLPIRLLGGFRELSLDLANSYFYPTSCSTVRACFQLALEKKYDFLDGFVMGSPCEHARRLFDIWSYWMSTPLIYPFSIMFVHGEEAVRYYEHELLQFKEKLEDLFGVEITNGALQQSIALYNQTRELLRKLNELRKRDNPPLTGAEALEVVNAAMTTPKEYINPILERLLEEASSGKRALEAKTRLMITGSMLNNPEFVKFIEDQGCTVVTEEQCSGVRYWMGLVDADLDPVKALARRYIVDRFPCHHFYPWEPRFDRIVELAKEYRVQGAVSELVRYCVALGFMRPLIRERLNGIGVPVLELELMYGAGGSGQVKTRVQALLEMIEGITEEPLEVGT